MNIEINQEFKALIPPLSIEEYSRLEKNIIADGCREPLVLWRPESIACPECDKGSMTIGEHEFETLSNELDKWITESEECWVCKDCDYTKNIHEINSILMDGHNRYEICAKNNIGFDVSYKYFTDSGAAKLWMIRNQFGRRNLSSFQRASLALEMKPMLAELAKVNCSLGGGDQKSGSQKSANPINPTETRKELAKEAGVSHDTISKVEKILAFADDETKQKLKNGDAGLSINKVHADIKKAERKTEQLIKEADSASKNINPDWMITDCQEIVKCDAVITDPPYGILTEDWDQIELESFTREWLARWNLCGADIFIVSWSERHLFDGRRWFDEELSNYSFQQLLIWHYPNNKKPSSRLEFKHTFEPIFFYRKIDSTKEISVGGGEWGEGINNFDCHVSATPQSNFNDENMKQHPAQKSIEVMKWLVNAATSKGELVADPFSGSGTTGMAANQLGRSFHGIEINKEFIELANKRIATYG